MRRPVYLRPSSLEAALAALAERPFTVVAGATDVYPARVGRPPSEDVLDLTGIAGTRGIEGGEDGWRIGAGTTWSELASTRLPPLFDGLRQAALAIGGPQIQNTGTLAGNLCTASPAADGAPCLLAMDASVELASVAGRRSLPLAEFLLGNRVTARRPDELLTHIVVPRPRGDARSAFTKLGARRYLVISIVAVAVVLEVEGETITRAGAAVGACAPTARRLPVLEARLVGRAANAAHADSVDDGCLAPLSPIDDIRGTATYRRDVCLTLLRRALAELAEPAAATAQARSIAAVGSRGS